jgi:tetratricopeptide (TPR) repeat protein
MNARALRTLTLLVLGTALACSSARQSPDTLMKDGLDALYTRSDAEAAVKAFRQVLAQNPGHYGANYQLAVALDRAGKPAEAVPQWERSLSMAESIKDEKTAETARKRLGRSGSSPQDAAMKAGLDALGKQDLATAILEFRRVLGMNPSHYGANFQLAKALDQSGEPAEARPLWEKVARMAEGFKDQATLDAARARLAQTP